MDSLLNTAPCGFLSFTEEGKIVQVNQTLANWLDCDASQLECHALESILSVGSRVFFHTHFFPMLKLQGYVEELYFSLRSHEGDALPILANAKRCERDSRVVYDCVFMKMTRRDQYENKILLAKQTAEASDQAKADLLAMLSHEFRTPLNAVMGFTEILAMEMEDVFTKEQKEYIAAINTGSEEILRLTTSILDFTELDMGHIDLYNQPFNVEGAIKQIEIIMAQQLKNSGIHYTHVPCNENPTVNTDLIHLQRILISLIENALKFTERGGSVSVSCAERAGRVYIHVRDSGCGIADADQDRIFEPFVQINRAQIKANQKGVGLGLPISRHLARAMGGDITVTSILGQGAIFTVTLPEYEGKH